MWRLDIPKTRQYDHGKIEVVARNSGGEAYCSCEINVNARQDDYRAVLKNSPKREWARCRAAPAICRWPVEPELSGPAAVYRSGGMGSRDQHINGTTNAAGHLTHYTFHAALAAPPPPLLTDI